MSFLLSYILFLFIILFLLWSLWTYFILAFVEPVSTQYPLLSEPTQRTTSFAWSRDSSRWIVFLFTPNNSARYFVLGTALSATSSATCFFKGVYYKQLSFSVFICDIFCDIPGDIICDMHHLHELGSLHRHLYATTEVLNSGHR